MRRKAIGFGIPMNFAIDSTVIAVVIATARSARIIVIIPMLLAGVLIVLLTRLMVRVVRLRMAFGIMRRNAFIGIGI